MNPHLTDALARLNERRGVHWGSKVQAVTERDLAPKTRKAIDGLTEVFELEVRDDGQVYLVKPGSAISADAATVSHRFAGSPAGHTPAPWTIIPARPHEEIEGAFEAFAGIEGADGSPVCLFGDGAGSATMFENEADYHLISAAPELLKALEHLAELFADLAPLGEQTTREVALVNARAAILKATGTTPNIKSEG